MKKIRNLASMRSPFLLGVLVLLSAIYESCGQNTTQKIDARQYTDSKTNPMASEAIGDTVKELSDNIMTVYQDKKNNYWFGSWVDGLYQYDGRTIIRYTIKDGLSHNRINQILEDNAGNMYLNTGEGINKFDGKRFTTISLTPTSNEQWKLEPDDLWFWCPLYSGVVYRYDGTTLHRLSFPVTEIGKEFDSLFPRSKYPNMNASPYAVYTIYNDSKGSVWFGTATLGVCRYNGYSLDWVSETDVTEVHTGPANGVRSIIEDQEGKFWFSNTLYRYDIYQNNTAGKGKSDNRRDNVFTYIREKGIGSLDGKEDGDFDEYMSAVLDKNGEVWIVMYGAGVWRYNPNAKLPTGKKNITHYPVTAGSVTITLFSIYKDNHDDLWLGTHEHGVYKFNGKTFERFRP